MSNALKSQVEKGRATSLPWEITREIKEGKALAGDSFTGEQLQVWFEQEKEAFYEGDSGNSDIDPWYSYMRYLNTRLAFSKIPDYSGQSNSILFLGPGSGIEVDNFVSERTGWKLSFIEASTNFKQILKDKFPGSVIVDPEISGSINLGNFSQDVVCAFSVLHHIPNVSFVIGEIHRVMKPGGLFLVREPCSSMGDWRFSRSATPNERGISAYYLRTAAERSGFKLVTKPIPIIFNPLNRFLKKTGLFSLMSFSLIYWIDRTASWIASWNDYYWRDAWYKKFGPSAYYYVFQKPEAE